MGRPRKNLERLFSDASQSLAAIQDRAPQFYVCPTGHFLPHRKPWGRCTVIDCCDTKDESQRASRYKPNSPFTKEVTPYQATMDLLPRGLEGMAYDLNQPNTTVESMQVEDRAQEAQALVRAHARASARAALVPLPAVPLAKEVAGDAKQWVEDRLQELTPLAVRELELALRYQTSAGRMEAAREILDRSGHGKNKPASVDFRGPVLIINNNGPSPWSKQADENVIDVTPILPEKT